MLSQINHQQSKKQVQRPRQLAMVLGACLLSMVSNVSSATDRAIERALEKSLQAEAERSVEDVVRFAVRAQMRRALEREVEGVVTEEAQRAVERVAGKGIDQALRSRLLKTALQTADMEAARIAYLKNSPTGQVQNYPLDKDAYIVAKPGNIKGDVAKNEATKTEIAKGGEGTQDSGNVTSDSADAVLLGGQLSNVEDTLRLSENMSSDLYGREIWSKEWVVMTDTQTRQKLLNKGYVFSDETYLEAFDQIVASVQAPASFDLQQDYQSLVEENEEGLLLVDYNHVYRNAQAKTVATSNNVGKTPAQLMPVSEKSLVIGMVDTAFNAKHSVFAEANMQQQHFLPEEARPIHSHGTGVASILVGNNETFHGLAKNAKLYNASVFFDVGRKEPIATATDILKGLNWLVQSGANVINMSLAGPANRLLEFGIKKLCSKGVYIVAAAGNAGPLSEPLYPAGYDCAVAVTAVDVEKHLYRYAVQGDHIDVAAYGVDVVTANTDGSLSASSGTSIAAPFITVVIADSVMSNQQHFNLELLLKSSLDLGDSGFDPLFGYGLLTLPLQASGGLAGF